MVFVVAGEYQGNGNTDGSFIYTGFRPSFILTKLANTGSEDWKLHDDRRPGRNETNDFVCNQVIIMPNYIQVTN